MDSISKCNEIYLQMVRQAGGAPGPISRTGAMLHIAMFEVINALSASTTTKYETYLNPIGCIPAADALQELSTVYAAQKLLLLVAGDPNVIPGAKQFQIITNLNTSFGTLLGDFAGATAVQHAESKTYGECVATMMFSSRQLDRYDDATPYLTPPTPGQWRSTQAGTMAATPNWGKVAPFGKWFPKEKFRPTAPGGYQTMSDLLSSNEYAAQLDEVKRLGSHTSTTRTADQTHIGFFWANDVDGTSKPPGQLYTMTSIVAQQRDMTLEETARLFALVAIAMGDAAIVAWDAKYDTGIDLWRPETAIQQANTDTNTDTIADPAWQPLSRTSPTGTNFTPPFPAYTSGHATFGAAHSAVMRKVCGTDNVTFTLTTEDPNAVGTTRTFNSFTAAALENARSRVYLGVHFQWDGDNGFLSGTQLGEYIADTFLKPVAAPFAPVILSESADTVDAEA